jgi:hypothetical protein
MKLSSLKNIFRTLLAKKGVKPSSNEHMIDLANNQMLCTGDVCACSWKPFHIKNDYPEKGRLAESNQ